MIFKENVIGEHSFCHVIERIRYFPMTFLSNINNIHNKIPPDFNI